MLFIKPKPVVITAAALSFLFAGYYLFREKLTVDRPPSLACQAETLNLSVKDGEEALLRNVSAYDEEDGDLTGSVLVENISGFVAAGKRIVTYAVIDSAGNVSKLSCNLIYRDYVGPRFSLSRSLSFEYGTSINLKKYLSAYDETDGDLTAKIRLSYPDGQSLLYEKGNHRVIASVTNSMGDTASVELIVTVGSFSGLSVELTDYLVYPNGKWDPLTYFASVSRGTEVLKEEALAGLTVSGEPDLTKNGSYPVVYRYTGENGETAEARLIAVVTGQGE